MGGQSESKLSMGKDGKAVCAGLDFASPPSRFLLGHSTFICVV